MRSVICFGFVDVFPDFLKRKTITWSCCCAPVLGLLFFASMSTGCSCPPAVTHACTCTPPETASLDLWTKVLLTGTVSWQPFWFVCLGDLQLSSRFCFYCFLNFCFVFWFWFLLLQAPTTRHNEACLTEYYATDLYKHSLSVSHTIF